MSWISQAVLVHGLEERIVNKIKNPKIEIRYSIEKAEFKSFLLSPPAASCRLRYKFWNSAFFLSTLFNLFHRDLH